MLPPSVDVPVQRRGAKMSTLKGNYDSWPFIMIKSSGEEGCPGLPRAARVEPQCSWAWES